MLLDEGHCQCWAGGECPVTSRSGGTRLPQAAAALSLLQQELRHPPRSGGTLIRLSAAALTTEQRSPSPCPSDRQREPPSTSDDDCASLCSAAPRPHRCSGDQLHPNAAALSNLAGVLILSALMWTRRPRWGGFRGRQAAAPTASALQTSAVLPVFCCCATQVHPRDRRGRHLASAASAPTRCEGQGLDFR